jgi:hypothetical protein
MSGIGLVLEAKALHSLPNAMPSTAPNAHQAPAAATLVHLLIDSSCTLSRGNRQWHYAATSHTLTKDNPSAHTQLRAAPSGKARPVCAPDCCKMRLNQPPASQGTGAHTHVFPLLQQGAGRNLRMPPPQAHTSRCVAWRATQRLTQHCDWVDCELKAALQAAQTYTAQELERTGTTGARAHTSTAACSEQNTPACTAACKASCTPPTLSTHTGCCAPLIFVRKHTRVSSSQWTKQRRHGGLAGA